MRWENYRSRCASQYIEKHTATALLVSSMMPYPRSYVRCRYVSLPNRKRKVLFRWRMHWSSLFCPCGRGSLPELLASRRRWRRESERNTCMRVVYATYLLCVAQYLHVSKTIVVRRQRYEPFIEVGGTYQRWNIRTRFHAISGKLRTSPTGSLSQQLSAFLDAPSNNIRERFNATLLRRCATLRTFSERGHSRQNSVPCTTSNSAHTQQARTYATVQCNG